MSAPQSAFLSDEPLQINLDGEPLADTQFLFEVLPRRLPICSSPCPASGPAVGSSRRPGSDGL